MGPVDQMRYLANRHWFQKDILRSHPIELLPLGSRPEVRLLTCHSHVWLSLYSLYSFYLTSGLRNPLVVHDDGSLDDDDRNLYLRLFPGTTILSRPDADRLVAPRLAEYPALAKWRTQLILALKILDLPLLSSSPFFILFDSDLFFFQKPSAFLDLLAECGNGAAFNVFGHSPLNAYSLARWQVRSAIDVDVPDRLNSGFGIVHPSSIELPLLNQLVLQDDLLGYPFWLEQTAFAALSARFGLRMLPEKAYRADLDAGIDGAVMKHYVGSVRHLFYVEAIPAFRRLLRTPPPPTVKSP